MPLPQPSASRVAVVYNPVKTDGAELCRVVDERAPRHGWTEVLYRETTPDDPGEGVTRELLADGVGLVLAVGGDGTVREVAAGLAHSGVPMGIVPRGTGNLLARNLAIPVDDLGAAVAIALGGRTRTMDIGEVAFTDGEGEHHEGVFLVMLGAGMDADMIAGTDSRLKARVGWPAYVGAFANTLLSGHRIKVEFGVDGSERSYSHTRSLLVANCGTLQGGMVLLPDAQIDDGLLDVLALRPKGVLGWVQASYVVLVEHTFLQRLERMRRLGVHLPELRRTRGSASTRPLDFRQGREMECVVLEEPAPFQVDGEDIGTVREFTARIRQRGLSVRVALR